MNVLPIFRCGRSVLDGRVSDLADARHCLACGSKHRPRPTGSIGTAHTAFGDIAGMTGTGEASRSEVVLPKTCPVRSNPDPLNY